VGGLLADQVTQTVFHDLPQEHDGDVRADIAHDPEVMADEDQRQRELPLQIPKQIEDLRLDRDIERRDWLIRDDQLRIEGDGPRNAGALTLATGELMRQVARKVAAEPDQFENLDHAPGGLGRAGAED
jgi:hypothetical protein